VLDGDESLWRIPAERMKMREAHIVPLARQSVDILGALSGLQNENYQRTKPQLETSLSLATMPTPNLGVADSRIAKTFFRYRTAGSRDSGLEAA